MFQPIYVEDVVTVIVKVLEDATHTNGKIYTIGGPEYYSFTQIFNELLKVLHTKRLKVYAPTPLVAIGAAMLEAILPRPPLTRAAMALFSFNNTTDLNSIERDFGFEPTSFHKYLEAQGI
jgi:NADH dehydrogenase